MPRFRVKDLLIATTLIAIGLGMLYVTPTVKNSTRGISLSMWGVLYVLIAFGVIGSGLGTPFHRPWGGALLLALFPVILAIIFILAS